MTTTIINPISKPVMFEARVLINSGCTGSVISSETVKRYAIPTIPLEKPLKVRNADGTKNVNGTIKEITRVQLRIGSHMEQIEFTVTYLAEYDAYLGHNWLVHHNPKID
jgi:hypothetical protein